MKFTTPAEPFRLFGELMVRLQASDRIREDLKRLIDELEENPTTVTLERVRPTVQRLYEELMALADTSPSFKAVRSSLSASVSKQLQLQSQDWKLLQTRYSELVTTTLTRETDALEAEIERIKYLRSLQ
jgi:hypothetical protein